METKTITPEFLDCLEEAVKQHAAPDGKAHLAKIGKFIKSKGYDYKEYCPAGLKELYMSLPDKFDTLVDKSKNPPVVFVSVKVDDKRSDSTVAEGLKEQLGNSTIMAGAVKVNTNADIAKKAPTRYQWCKFKGNEMLIFERLATRLAHKECWNFANKESRPYAILRTYLYYTFKKLKDDSKVLYDGDYAAINTGLVSDDYDPIYALLQKETPTDKFYTLVDFCLEGVGPTGRMLKTCFHPLPERAEYRKDKEDYVFEGNKEIEANWEHIIIHNVDRFPASYLEKFKIVGVEDMHSSNAEKREKAIESIKKQLTTERLLFQDIIDDLDSRIMFARKRVKVNHNYVLPMYYPDKDVISFILPIALDDNNKDEINLTLAVNKAGDKYVATTVLTLAMAYKNARLITEPMCSWLDPKKISE